MKKVKPVNKKGNTSSKPEPTLIQKRLELGRIIAKQSDLKQEEIKVRNNRSMDSCPLLFIDAYILIALTLRSPCLFSLALTNFHSYCLPLLISSVTGSRSKSK